jgi:hypothetical protein
LRDCEERSTLQSIKLLSQFEVKCGGGRRRCWTGENVDEHEDLNGDDEYQLYEDGNVEEDQLDFSHLPPYM